MAKKQFPVIRPIIFKDQPDGDCMSCRWNKATSDGSVTCGIPQTHLRNPICIAKLQLTIMGNIGVDLDHLYDDPDWDLGDSTSLPLPQ